MFLAPFTQASISAHLKRTLSLSHYSKYKLPINYYFFYSEWFSETAAWKYQKHLYAFLSIRQTDGSVPNLSEPCIFFLAAESFLVTTDRSYNRPHRSAWRTMPAHENASLMWHLFAVVNVSSKMLHQVLQLRSTKTRCPCWRRNPLTTWRTGVIRDVK